MAVKIGGTFFDIEPAVRGFQRYDSDSRADRRASFRLGYRQREQVGEAFWTHPLLPGVCFPTRAECYRAVLEKLSTPTEHPNG